MEQPTTPPVDTPVWYCMMGTQKLGPLTMQTVLTMIQNRSIESSTLLWREGMASWQPAAGIPEFTFAFANTAGISIRMGGPKEEAALGLTWAGLVLFIVLLFVCLPLCWLPWVLDSTRASR